jgi:hypothetical protein
MEIEKCGACNGIHPLKAVTNTWKKKLITKNKRSVSGHAVVPSRALGGVRQKKA